MATGFGSVPDEAALRDDVDRALAGRVDIAAWLADRATERRGRIIRHAEPRVAVVSDVSADAHVLEVRAHDEPGLL